MTAEWTTVDSCVFLSRGRKYGQPLPSLVKLSVPMPDLARGQRGLVGAVDQPRFAP